MHSHASHSAADSHGAGARLAEQLCEAGDEPLRAVFVLSDGLCVNGTPLVAGLTAGLPRGVAITGGLAGDGSRFARTWVLDRQRTEANHVCAVGFYGEPSARRARLRRRLWTSAPSAASRVREGNVLFELDGKPALELYKTYLGERAAGLPGTALLFPLAVRRDRTRPTSRWCVPILAVDEETQSMTFAGDMPEGGIARLMHANSDRLIGSAGRLRLRAAASALPDTGATRWRSRSAASAADWCSASASRRRSRACSKRLPVAAPRRLLLVRRDLAGGTGGIMRAAQPDDDDDHDLGRLGRWPLRRARRGRAPWSPDPAACAGWRSTRHAAPTRSNSQRCSSASAAPTKRRDQDRYLTRAVPEVSSREMAELYEDAEPDVGDRPRQPRAGERHRDARRARHRGELTVAGGSKLALGAGRRCSRFTCRSDGIERPQTCRSSLSRRPRFRTRRSASRRSWPRTSVRPAERAVRDLSRRRRPDGSTYSA